MDGAADDAVAVAGFSTWRYDLTSAVTEVTEVWILEQKA